MIFKDIKSMLNDLFYIHKTKTISEQKTGEER